MIKQPTTQERPEFGKIDPAHGRRRQVRKALKSAPQPTPEKLCAFQVLEPVQGEKPWEKLMKSAQCKNEALPNGWCSEHKHAQSGMDEGERLGYRSVEIPVTRPYGDEEPFKIIIGWGKQNWLVYFERARDPGLAKVLDYLKRL